MLKMRAPEGVTAFSHQGYPVEIGEDGAVHVDPRHRGDLEAHGFRPWDTAPAAAPAIAAAGRKDLDGKRAILVALFTDTVASLTDEEVDGMIANANERLRLEREDAERIDPAKVTAEDIGHMKRHELFAFLKKRGIPAVPPIDNETLRQKVRAALAAD